MTLVKNEDKKQAPNHKCPRCKRVELVKVGKLNPGEINLYECFFCGQRKAGGDPESKHWPRAQHWLDGQKLRPLP